MDNGILIKSFGYIFIIALGYTLKKIKLFGEDEYRTLVKILMKITLPAIIVASFSSAEVDFSLIYVTLVCVAVTLTYLFFGYILTRGKDKETQNLYMINFPGYNIGNFSLPFVAGFLGKTGIVATCMFDVGNALIVTGFSYAIATGVTNTGEKRSLKETLLIMLTSGPLLAYLIMVVLVSFKIKLPDFIVTTATTIGGANTFLSMFIIGLMFDIKFKKEYLLNSTIIISIRVAFAVIFAYLVYKFLPTSIEVRKAVVILVFSPLTSLAPIFTEKAGGKKEISSFIGAMSIIISIISILLLIKILY
ncbi:AEC family transporter [Fusobacterium sp. PH5-44]|uniref:AEC family transporter n=1 Tax=unclassified Fusobacterium TaxID=2648384 RepID=UPI003D1E46E3